MEIHLPADLESRQEFRALRAQGHERDRAIAIVFLLFRELTYAAQAGEPVGHLTDASAHLLSDEATLDCEHLVRSKWLVRVETGGFHCAFFARLNAHLDPNAQPLHRVGADRSVFVRAQKKVEQAAAQLSLLVDPAVFSDLDGTPLNAEEVRKVTVLIKSVDNALFRPDRPPGAFSVGLVHDALRLLRGMDEREIGVALTELSRRRNHPALLGQTAEGLLPKLRETVKGLLNA